MKKILIVTSGFPLWKTEGLNVFMLEFAQAIAKNYEVFVLAPFSKKAKRVETIGNITVYRHNQFPFINAELAYGSGIVGNIKKNPLLLFAVPFYFILQVWAIRKIVKKHTIEIVNAHWIIPQGVTSVIYKKLFNRKIKIMSTVHGSDFNALNNFIGNAMKNFVLKNSNAITAVSQELCNGISAKGYKNVHICPMGIDTTRFSPENKNAELRKRLGADNGFLLYVGGLIEGKGVRYLVSAMPEIVVEFPEIKLVMIGEGYLENELKILSETLGVEKNVLFAGIIPNADLPPYFATADIFILPSFSEGYSLVIREALACGTPVIATDLDVFKKDIPLYKNILTFSPRNSDDIADKIIAVLNINREEKEKKSNFARQYAIDFADWKVTTGKYLFILNKL